MPFVTADRMRERPAEERAGMGKVDICHVEVEGDEMLWRVRGVGAIDVMSINNWRIHVIGQGMTHLLPLVLAD